MTAVEPEAAPRPALFGRTGKLVLLAVGLAVVLNLVLAAANVLGRSDLRRSLSTSASRTGLSGYAELLERTGHRVVHEPEALDKVRLDRTATYVLLDAPRLSQAEAKALGAILRGGARVVIGGHDPARWLAVVAGDGAPRWRPTGPEQATPATPVTEVVGISSVQTAGEGGWSDPKATLPVLCCPGKFVAAVANVGKGRALLLADASPLQNRLLAKADNASFGLAIAGDPERTVVFADHAHGPGDPTGFAALPLRVRVAIGCLIAAVITAMAARGSRLGRPNVAGAGAGGDAPGAAPRAGYVEALGDTLRRTKHPAAAGPIQAAAVDIVRQRAGLLASAPPEEVRDAAVRLGLPPDEAAALAAPLTSEAQALAAGRALARLKRPRAGTP